MPSANVSPQLLFRHQEFKNQFGSYMKGSASREFFKINSLNAGHVCCCDHNYRKKIFLNHKNLLESIIEATADLLEQILLKGQTCLKLHQAVHWDKICEKNGKHQLFKYVI